ncbi:hypothetical protein ME9_00012 [Bartonella taylorii 8TBB]|uniref:Uncharacterized protein n=1 Tax=Bartonella taylorii 8TBB TaxID=1094560 RepID=A0A9P2S101_BARTA|nr:hypothetical protein ME9_00012 [Bartonella taylorii 8TBB]
MNALHNLLNENQKYVLPPSFHFSKSTIRKQDPMFTFSSLRCFVIPFKLIDRKKLCAKHPHYNFKLVILKRHNLHKMRYSLKAPHLYPFDKTSRIFKFLCKNLKVIAHIAFFPLFFFLFFTHKTIP